MTAVQYDLLTKRGRKVRAPAPSEFEIQATVVACLRRFARPGVLFFHTPNGGIREKREGAKFRAMGVRPGVADLMFLHQGKVLFLELKRPGGRSSEAQIAFAADARAAGADYEIRDSVTGALSLLVERGMLREGSYV